MRAVIVLAAHGAPPLDFPRTELAEFFALRARFAHAFGEEYAQRHRELEDRIRRWPRNHRNDPFYAGSQELAVQLRRASGRKVILGFNEFCRPTLDEALDQAAGLNAGRIVVVTPMLTRGGEHAERDIPDAVERARRRHPDQTFVYVWPFPPNETAEFISLQLAKHL